MFPISDVFYIVLHSKFQGVFYKCLELFQINGSSFPSFPNFQPERAPLILSGESGISSWNKTFDLNFSAFENKVKKSSCVVLFEAQFLSEKAHKKRLLRRCEN